MTTEIRQTPAISIGMRTQEDIVTSPALRKVLAAARIIIGFGFLWPFLDKLFGLHYATPAQGAWIAGGSPAQGYIAGIEGPFANFFSIFENAFGDWFFMLGLFGIGIAMITGAGLRIAAVGGTILMLFMYLADLPSATAFVDGEMIRGATNPILDSHWYEALLLIIPAMTLAGDTWGLGKWWASLPLVQNNPWLR